MNVKIDLERVVDLEYNVEGDGIWSISVAFDDGEAMTYGYTDLKKYMVDCTELANRRIK